MGTGYHGGFGKTKGSALKKAQSHGLTNAGNNTNIRKKDIIEALMGFTEMSTLIAKSIATNEIGVNILGDELFDSLIKKEKGIDAKSVKGFQYRHHMYVRRSALNGFSIFVHEGTHAYEFRNKIPQNQIMSRKGEMRAYFNEHDYQIKKGEHVEFKNLDEILVHIRLHYK